MRHAGKYADIADSGKYSGQLTRTSILVPVEVDKALRELAHAGQRPLSWEVRRALENHVEAAKEERHDHRV